MRELYASIFYIMIFVYGFSLFLGFLGNQFGLTGISDLAITEEALGEQSDAALGNLNQTGGFNLNLVFGDWTKPITSFIDLMTLQNVVDMMGKMGFPQNFTEPLRIGIFAMLAIGGLMYAISGRQ